MGWSFGGSAMKAGDMRLGKRHTEIGARVGHGVDMMNPRRDGGSCNGPAEMGSNSRGVGVEVEDAARAGKRWSQSGSSRRLGWCRSLCREGQ